MLEFCFESPISRSYYRQLWWFKHGLQLVRYLILAESSSARGCSSATLKRLEGSLAFLAFGLLPAAHFADLWDIFATKCFIFSSHIFVTDEQIFVYVTVRYQTQSCHYGDYIIKCFGSRRTECRRHVLNQTVYLYDIITGVWTFKENSTVILNASIITLTVIENDIHMWAADTEKIRG